MNNKMQAITVNITTKQPKDARDNSGRFLADTRQHPHSPNQSHRQGATASSRSGRMYSPQMANRDLMLKHDFHRNPKAIDLK